MLVAKESDLQRIEEDERADERHKMNPTYRKFQAAIQETLDRIPTIHAAPLAALMTLNFQRFEDVSLLTVGILRGVTL